MNEKELKKDYDEKDCSHCVFNNSGICDHFGILNHYVKFADCKKHELQLKGN